MSRFLGIDYGTKRVGLALSDESATIARPHSVLPTTDTLVADIAELCSREQIGGIVVGESTDYKGNDNAVMQEIRTFAKALQEAIDVPLSFEPEFLTTAEAARIQGHHELLDASAAALLLQRYLDKHA